MLAQNLTGWHQKLPGRHLMNTADVSSTHSCIYPYSYHPDFVQEPQSIHRQTHYPNPTGTKKRDCLLLSVRKGWIILGPLQRKVVKPLVELIEIIDFISYMGRVKVQLSPKVLFSPSDNVSNKKRFVVIKLIWSVDLNGAWYWTQWLWLCYISVFTTFVLGPLIKHSK